MSYSSKPGFVALALMTMVALLLAACDSGNPTTTPTSGGSGSSGGTSVGNPTATTDNSTSAGNPTPATASGGGSGSGGVLPSDSFVAGLATIKSYHMAYTATIGTNTNKVNGDFIFSDNANNAPAKANITIDDGSVKVNYIVIGSTALESKGGGPYQPSSMGKLDTDDYASAFKLGLQMLTPGAMKAVGSEAIAGVDCIHYSYSNPSAKVGNTQDDVWVAKSDNTVRKLKGVNAPGPYASTTIFTISNVNGVSDITAPK